MVLENNTYPRDARVRLEAETLAGAGLEVEVLAPREAGRPRREYIGGVLVTRLRLIDGHGTIRGTAVEYAVAALVMAAAVVPRLARSRRGALHVHNPPDFFFPLLALARMRGWSAVYDHHDDSVGMMRDKLGRPSRVDAVLAWMRRCSARAADVAIATNDTQRDLLASDAARVEIVRNCPPAWFAEHRATEPEGRVRLVFLGEIGEQDRVDMAVEVLAGLVDSGLDAELLVIGEGPCRAAVEQRAERLGLADRLTVTGWVAYEQVPVLLASAHVGIDTAPPTEVNNGSTMVKIREYLVVGLPVVASALRETAITGGDAVTLVGEDSVAGFQVPLQRLLASPEAWREDAERARARGLQLLWPTQAEVLLGAYRELGMPVRQEKELPAQGVV
jgi:glycosyltransferase involved in cell wall biosynthesis